MTTRFYAFHCLNFAILFFILLLAGCASSGDTQSNSSEVERLKKENALLKQQVILLRQQLQSGAHRRSSFPGRRASAVEFGSNPVLGSTSATLAMIEFSDYFCPFCSRYHSTTYERIKRNYIDSGKIKYVYRDFPRAMAGRAINAAIAVNCAGKQGAYWKMQKILYRYSPRINATFYISTARKLGLDEKKYEHCLNDVQQRSAVSRDFSYGRSLGIRGTPTFYIGRVSGNKITGVVTIVGAQPYGKFSQTIDRLLQSRKQP